ncbi:Thioredoxin [Planctomycetes bacterium MalM25]|nr:Thioredoxin [Planctomycetes bacterium MalM25]
MTMLLTLTNRAGFALLALAAMANAAAAQSEGVAWRTDFDAARGEATQAGKLLLVHFWTESCGPCRVLEKRVFSQPQVAMGIATDYVPVKINANEAPELAKAFGVTRVPTDVVVAADGKPIKAFISPSTPMEYVGTVRQLAATYRSQSGGVFSAVSQAAPAPNGLQPPASPQSNDRYAQFASAPTPPAYVPQGVSPAVTPVSVPTAPAATENRYAAPAPAATPAPPAPATSNPYAAASVAPVTPAPVTPIAPAAPAPSSQAASQLPPGSPPLGFEGFCPVTMKNEWRWAKGDARFGAIHEGRTYLFSSAEAQKAFLATPDAFSPVLAGADPVAAVDQQRSLPGVREHAVEYQGRFYLFANEQTLERFWSNPDGYAAGVKRVAALPAESSFIR